jgi:hypothetical protein
VPAALQPEIAVIGVLHLEVVQGLLLARTLIGGSHDLLALRAFRQMA